MSNKLFYENLQSRQTIRQEHLIESAQSTQISINGQSLLNFCANNYLGLANHPKIIESAIQATQIYGYGMASVRFICGTHQLHQSLETSISRLIGHESAILYAAAFDANGGLFEPLLNEQDAIISDELNHASIIDGIRLCKAKRYRYKNIDMNDLETKIIQARLDGARHILIVTDGVFSMDGLIAPLNHIIELAQRYDCLSMVDECHATGVLGKTGRGSAEYFNVLGQVDLTTGTFGKALGGALGGFTVASKQVVAMLKDFSRPYLFSNALPPSICAGSIAAIDLLTQEPQRVEQLWQNIAYFRQAMQKAGFEVGGQTAICPIILGDALLAKQFSDELFKLGILATSFSYPVVPQGKARIRIQISSQHTQAQLDAAIEAFKICQTKFM